MAQPLNVAMLGASGRMGRVIVPWCSKRDPHSGRRAGCLVTGRSAGCGAYAVRAAAVAIGDDPRSRCPGRRPRSISCVPAVSIANARSPCDRRCAMVIGTTGHDGSQRDALEDLARTIPVVLAPEHESWREPAQARGVACACAQTRTTTLKFSRRITATRLTRRAARRWGSAAPRRGAAPTPIDQRIRPARSNGAAQARADRLQRGFRGGDIVGDHRDAAGAG